MLQSKYSIIKNSGFFDEKYYLKTYEDIKKGNIDSIKHYLKNGWKEGRNPSSTFETSFYLENYKDVKDAKVNPLIHYILHGQKENRVTNRQDNQYLEEYKIIKESNLLDEVYYSKTYPDVDGLNPIEHYIKYGWKEGRNPSSNFETTFYLENNKDVKDANINPLVHYVLYGQKEGRVSNKLYKIISESDFFDRNYYIEAYANIDVTNPIKYYIEEGWKNGEIPNRYLDINAYRIANHDLQHLNDLQIFTHFIQYGYDEVQKGLRSLYCDLHKFNKEEYLAENIDVKNASESGAIDVFEHYFKYGSKEIQNRERYSESVYFQTEVHEFKNKYLNNVINPIFTKIDINQNLIVPIFEKPKVSIIIPAYNQADYTYNTVFSIIESNPKTSYEIIIADDKSPDIQARELNKTIKNVKFFTNEENLGFTKNCNKGAKFASGEFVLFLNNDTFVVENWLDSLVELIESNDKMGMVGSKLVYPDGRQQEAGGIIWNDASGWNFGRLDNPMKSEYNYVKEVDYMSGASIMLSKKLWEEIGGFDERYAPAYFEDSDLAFEVRKHGYKVMFQPKSIVVHFEGISHGTDTGSGIKAYQVKNKEKFIEKWKNELEINQFSNAENVFLARDRSRDKKHILIIDHYVPHFDQDAGSRTIFGYIKLFLSNNYSVSFIGDNYYKHEPYSSILEQMGVEILYGSYYKNNHKIWLNENLKYFDYVFINRPHITEKYIDVIKDYSKVKILYYGHDLHFLRDYREYILTNNEEKLIQSNYWKKIELELMSKVDVALYPSVTEVEEIKKINSEIEVKAIPAYLFEDFHVIERNIKSTKNVMFVGGFAHTPNIDAVLWFVNNVWDEIKKELPSVKFYIIGSKPTKDILSLASEDIIVTGFVSDDELKNYYKSTRIAVVPLRYGAGIKGKVVEALYEQIPIITTSVGSEGLFDAENYMTIEDDANNFACKLIQMYNDEEKLFELSQSGKDYCSNYFSYESFKIALKKYIDFGES